MNALADKVRTFKRSHTRACDFTTTVGNSCNCCSGSHNARVEAVAAEVEQVERDRDCASTDFVDRIDDLKRENAQLMHRIALLERERDDAKRIGREQAQEYRSRADAWAARAGEYANTLEKELQNLDRECDAHEATRQALYASRRRERNLIDEKRDLIRNYEERFRDMERKIAHNTP